MRKKNERGGKRMMVKILVVLLLINSVSFMVCRAAWYMSGAVAAKLQLVRGASSKVMNYFVAGNVNQPERAFKFLEDKIDGGITYVTYSEKKGCSMRQIAEQVIDDADILGCKARIFGISIGDYVSRLAEEQLDDVETIAINPEPHPSILKPYANYGLKIVTPIMEVLTIPAGWLSYIPCIRGFSLAFLADQWRDIAYCRDAPMETAMTLGVICSTEDEFLQNDVIEEYFKGVPIVYANCNHGNTEDRADEYIRAWEELQALLDR